MANPTKNFRPCFGGPFDGQFRSESFAPLGYRPYKIRGRMIWLWKGMKVEHIDFDTLSRAARLPKSSYQDLEGWIEEPGSHLEPQ